MTVTSQNKCDTRLTTSAYLESALPLDDSAT